MHASQSGPMLGSVKSASGTSRIHHSSRMVTVSRVAGTGHHLSGSDEGNAPNSPVQVEGPHGQPQLNKQRQCTHNQNKEIIYCYYMATMEKQRGYRMRMYETWQSRVNFECTEQRLCDQRKQIIDKALLTEA